MKPVQYFSDEYLQQCKAMSTEQIAKFLEAFRLMRQPEDKNATIADLVQEFVRPTESRPTLE